MIRAAPASSQPLPETERVRKVSSTPAVESASELTADEREWIIASVISSLALEDIHVPADVAARLLDDALLEPLPDLD